MAAFSRRDFLAASALTLSAAGYSRAANRPNDTLRVAVMGVRSRGKDLLGTFLKVPGVEISYLVDPDESMIPAALAVATKAKHSPKAEADVRKVLEDKTLDALVVAAPDHWHALATVWACQADKHVYCEKPASHNLVEGRRMVQAARKHKRQVQIGTQRRSAAHVHAAREFVSAGKLGKIPFARAWIAGSRPSIGHKADAPVPAGVNYDLWLGPAKDRPFNPNRFHYEWHWFWDYGTGEIGNNGIHGLDLARFVLGLDAPIAVTSAGGKFFYDDDREVPDTQLATFTFPNCSLVWEHRFWEKNGLEGESFGVSLHGEKGTMVFNSKGWHVRDGVTAEEKHGPDMQLAHVTNFCDAIRAGKALNADVEEGHKSTRLCHLGNIAHRTGRSLVFDAASETCGADKEANALLGREYRKGFDLPSV
jgi:predicted dehydrogenase